MGSAVVVSDQARNILREAPSVWDLTLPWVEMYWSIDVLRRYHEAGYTFISLTTQDMPPTFAGVLTEVARFRQMCTPHSDWLTFARTQQDIDDGRSAGKLVLGLNVQDTVLVHEDLDRLHVLRDLGVRHMLLAYQLRNAAADGCAEPGNAGLSLFGRRLIREMNAAGMIVDCAHTGRRSSMEAMEISTEPVIFSHVGAYGQNAHFRCVDDAQIRACAQTGGAIGIVGIGAFLGDPRASSETMFRHVDHAVQLVGPAHVGIGTDYIEDLEPVWPSIIEASDEMWHDPTGPQVFEGVAFAPEQLVELVQLMVDHGYEAADIHGILGGNFHRIYHSVWNRAEYEGEGSVNLALA